MENQERCRQLPTVSSVKLWWNYCVCNRKQTTCNSVQSQGSIRIRIIFWMLHWLLLCYFLNSPAVFPLGRVLGGCASLASFSGVSVLDIRANSAVYEWLKSPACGFSLQWLNCGFPFHTSFTAQCSDSTKPAHILQTKLRAEVQRLFLRLQLSSPSHVLDTRCNLLHLTKLPRALLGTSALIQLS